MIQTLRLALFRWLQQTHDSFNTIAEPLCITTIVVFATLLFSCKSDPTPVTDPQKSRLDSIEIFRKAFSSPEDCKGCHPQQYEEWAMSMHAYAVVDPVFHSVNALGQQVTDGKLGQFCVNCHSPFATLLNEAPDGIIKDQKLLSPISRGGVTCDGCHKIESQVPGHGVTKWRLDGVMYGTIKDPVSTPAHGSVYNKTFEEGEACSGCHDIINPRGVQVEATFSEFKYSSYPQRGIPCQVCHMKTSDGLAAVGGPTRRIHSHIMEGVDVPLVDFPGRERMIDLVRYQLEFSITATPENLPLSIRKGATLPVTFSLYNQHTGHNVPSGAIYERQMWVETVVINELGDTVFATGLLDPNKDLLNEKSEYVQKGLLAPDTSLVLFNGKAFRHDKEIDFFFDADVVVNRTIPPFSTRFARYQIPPALYKQSKSLTVKFRLLFRAMPPYFLRKLGHADLVDKLPVFEMESYERTIPIE